MSGPERLVSFLANCIAIVGFVAALAGWLGVIPLPAYVPPNDRVAKAIVIAFCIVASYGMASFLRSRLDGGSPAGGVAVISSLACVPYCFAVAQLGGFLSASMDDAQRASVLSVAFFSGWLAHFFINLMLLVFKMQFPRGFDLWRWFTGMFRSEYWASLAVLIFDLAAVPWLLNEFGAVAAP
jgi:hypothetical protein